MDSVIRTIRLHNQQLVNSQFKNPDDLVSHFGAMQAQDFQMAKWAVGLRCGTTEKTVENAINQGTILRTHILRPTWHFVAARDIHWILEVTAPHIKTILKSSCKNIGLDEKTLVKTNTIIERLLSGNHHLTRETLVAAIEEHNIPTKNYGSSHILMHAELEGLICSGSISGNKTTYALLEERVRKPIVSLPREEALAKLAQTYFKSHGPATLQDFTWWSGLSVNGARLALESIKPDMEEIKADPYSYWFYAPTPRKKTVVSLLPSFDEFLISYKNRTAAIDLEHQPKAFTNNGIFNPVLLVDGKIEGVWKRNVKKDRITVEINPFIDPDESLHKKIASAIQVYEKFLLKEITASYHYSLK